MPHFIRQSINLPEDAHKYPGCYGGMAQVREANGVRLCGEHLGIQSVQVLDPTLLLTPGEYERLVHEQDEAASPGDLFCYLLDRNPGTKLFKQDLEHELGLTAFEIMPQAIGADKHSRVRYI